MRTIENRKHQRINLNCPIEIMHPAGNNEVAKIMNISAGGVRIVVKRDEYAKPGNIYELLFTVNVNNEAVDINAKGTICFVHHNGDTTELGISFTDIAENDQLRLMQFVALKLRSLELEEAA